MTGPPLAGVLVGFAGSIAAFFAIAICFAAATVCIGRIRSPTPRPPPTGKFLGQALEGLVYVIRHRLLRSLAIGYALNNFTWGVLVVAVPVVMAERFSPGTWEAATGLLWAVTGLAGGIGALAAGQLRVLHREVPVMTVCMVLTALAVWPIAAIFGVTGLALGMATVGLLEGPIDVGHLLTLRQRRIAIRIVSAACSRCADEYQHMRLSTWNGAWRDARGVVAQFGVSRGGSGFAAWRDHDLSAGIRRSQSRMTRHQLNAAPEITFGKRPR